MSQDERTLKTATQDWQRSAFEDGWAGATGRSPWLVRSDYRYSSPFNPELVRWYNAGWDAGELDQADELPTDHPSGLGYIGDYDADELDQARADVEGERARVARVFVAFAIEATSNGAGIRTDELGELAAQLSPTLGELTRATLAELVAELVAAGQLGFASETWRDYCSIVPAGVALPGHLEPIPASDAWGLK